MNVLILTLGTRGDIELFLFLAQALQARGHTVTILTSAEFADTIRAAGIACHAIDEPASRRHILQSLAGEPDPRRRTLAFFRLWLQPMLQAASAPLMSLAQTDDY